MLRLLCGTLLAIGGASAAAASCGTAECPLDLEQHARAGGTGGLSLQVAFEAIDQDQPFHRGKAVDFGQVLRPDHDEIETRNRNLRLMAAYSATPHLDLSLTLPVLQRRHAHLETAGHVHDGHDHGHGGGLQEWSFTRPGDLAAWGRYRLVGPLTVGLGLSLPTGATDVRNRAGVRAEPTLQPGRGAWGFMAEAAYSHRPDPDAGRGAALFASAFYRHNAAGRRGYTFGDEWALHAGGRYRLTDRLDLLLQAAGRHTGRDRAGRSGERTDATGGTFAYISPGLQVSVLPGVDLYGYYQVPLYRRVNSVQLTADRNLLFGLAYEFNLL